MKKKSNKILSNYIQNTMKTHIYIFFVCFESVAFNKTSMQHFSGWGRHGILFVFHYNVSVSLMFHFTLQNEISILIVFHYTCFHQSNILLVFHLTLEKLKSILIVFHYTCFH